MKQGKIGCRLRARIQPPSGGCVLKPTICTTVPRHRNQPPSGGCVLKPVRGIGASLPKRPAAFRRLCVETARWFGYTARIPAQPPSGGCVLKLCWLCLLLYMLNQPPSGGCVLKPPMTAFPPPPFQEPAAFRRLCVETRGNDLRAVFGHASRLQAAVC